MYFGLEDIEETFFANLLSSLWSFQNSSCLMTESTVSGRHDGGKLRALMPLITDLQNFNLNEQRLIGAHAIIFTSCFNQSTTSSQRHCTNASREQEKRQEA